MTDLAAVETHLWTLLGAYRPPLVDATIYGMPNLIWPGFTGHAYFAAVKPASKHVSLLLVTLDQHPEALEGLSPGLIERRTGKATMQFTAVDDALTRELPTLLERLFESYRRAHEGSPD